MKELADKVALITGAASGIGRASVVSLARRGVRVVIVDINEAGAQETADIVRKAGGDALAVQSDIRDSGAFEKLRAVALDRYGRVDILMNNAGVLVAGLPQDIPVTEWERALDINLMAAIRAIRVFIPDLLARACGHIVNTASFAGLFPYAFDRLPYAASKGALVTLSEGLALYLKPRGVGVTLLCPGPVRTNIGASLKNWTPGLELRSPGPQFGFRTAAEVGEMVAEAIRADRFFLPTDDQVRQMLQRRAADPDEFIRAQLAISGDLAVPPAGR